MNCPVCNSNETELRFYKNEYKILYCLNCTHRFTNFIPSENEVQQIYSDDYFFKGGAGYDDYTLDSNIDGVTSVRSVFDNRGRYFDPYKFNKEFEKYIENKEKVI